MANFLKKQLEKKSLYKKAMIIAWPAVLESFFVAIAGMIDTAMVSTLGPVAVAAVGLTNQPKFLFLGPLFAVSTAVSALVSRRFGEEKRKEANQTLVTATVLSLFLIVAIMVICLLYSDPIIRFSGGNAETQAMADMYFRIIMGSNFFLSITIIINAAQRGTGNTRVAFTTNFVSSIVNIVFNYLLIKGHLGFPQLGVQGAAIATVLGTIVGFLMSLYSLMKTDSYIQLSYIFRNKLLAARSIAHSIFSLGSTVAAEEFLMRIGFMATAIIAARISTDAFAIHSVTMNLLNLGFSFSLGMETAAMTLTGISLGSGRKDRAFSYGRVCQQIGLLMAIILSFLIFFFGEAYFHLHFTDPESIAMGVVLCRYVMIIVLFQIQQVVYGGVLRAAGDVKYSLISSTLSVTVIRTVATILLVYQFHLGLHGIWLGVLMDQVSRFFLFLWRFRQRKWVEIQI